MQFDMEAENSNNGGSEQAITSEDGQFLVAFRKIMKKEIEVLVIRTVEQKIVPIIGELIRKVVKEEIQPVVKRLLAGNTNEVTMSNERRLQLKLSNEVCDPVLTGNSLEGKKGDLKVELVDRETGRVVENEPISSAKVEILVLDASRDDSEHNWTQESFNNRIIRKGDKERPHFSKNIYIDLEKGVGFLRDVKLGHDSNWMKGFKCRLGARIVDGFRGVHVQEGRTGSFMVIDRRSKQYEKHCPPSLSDEVWRLVNIGKDGARHKRLNNEKVETVGDFRFLLSVDPHRLQKLVCTGAKWNATVDHARTCPKDDKVYLHYPSTSNESKVGVIFDAVGGLKGIIKDSRYVPINDLSSDEKDGAHELLLPAFENREARTCFDDEASLLKQFPSRSSDINSPTNSSIQGASNGNCLIVPEYIDVLEPGNDAYIPTLDRANNSPILDSPTPFPSCSFPDPGTSSQCTITAFGNPNDMPHFGPLRSPVVLSPSYDFNVEDIWSMMSQNDSSSCNLSEILGAEPLSRRYRLVTVAKAKVWVLRAKKRVIMSLEGIHAHKKQKTN